MESRIDQSRPSDGADFRRRGRGRVSAVVLLVGAVAALGGFVAGNLVHLGGSRSEPAEVDEAAAARQFFGHEPPRGPGEPGSNPALPSGTGALALLPLPPRDSVQAFATQPAHSQLPVQSVVPGHGVWVGTNPADRVFVRLDATDQLSLDLKVGQSLDVVGTFTGVPEDFASTFGMVPDDVEQLGDQGVYVTAMSVKPA